MTPEAIHEAELSAPDEAMIANLLTRAFGADFDGRSYYKQRPHLRLVIREDGRIVGHMALVMRDIRLGERLCPIAGLAEVATDPERRGAGIASTLLAEAVRRARGSLAQFMVLFGDRPLYAGHGFVMANNQLTYPVLDDVRTHGVTRRVDRGLMILPLRDAAWDFAARIDLVGHLF